MAFWDKRNNQQALVVATHGLIKKASKVPGREIDKALRIRMEYLKLRILEMAKKKVKTVKMTLDQVKDKHLGQAGSPGRNLYEFDLKRELLAKMIKAVRRERKLTQEELGKLIGVQKAQISKLESNTKNVTLETILKVFEALDAKVKFSVQLEPGQQ